MAVPDEDIALNLRDACVQRMHMHAHPDSVRKHAAMESITTSFTCVWGAAYLYRLADRLVKKSLAMRVTRRTYTHILRIEENRQSLGHDMVQVLDVAGVFDVDIAFPPPASKNRRARIYSTWCLRVRCNRALVGLNTRSAKGSENTGVVMGHEWDILSNTDERTTYCKPPDPYLFDARPAKSCRRCVGNRSSVQMYTAPACEGNIG